MTEETPRQRRGLRFGVFEVDLLAGALRKNGLKVRLQDQPFRLLTLLLEKPGEVVTRDDIRERLWPDGTYVDFDRSLSTAASKLREALGDSASSPRFIETLPRRGYRFLASVETAGGLPIGESAEAKAEAGSTGGLTPERGMHRQPRWAWAVAAIAAVAAVAAVVMYLIPAETEAPRAVLRKFTLDLPGWSHSVAGVVRAVISPNAKHIVYASSDNRKLAVWDLSQGRQRVLEGTDRAFSPFWSPDSGSIGFWAEAGGLQRVSVKGGPVTPLCEVAGNSSGAAWSPDGKSIVFGVRGELFEVGASGGAPRVILPPNQSDGTAGEQAEQLGAPHFLPMEAGRALVFTSGRRKLMLLDLDTGDYEDLAAEARVVRDPFYSPSGHIVYLGARGSIWALPFS